MEKIISDDGIKVSTILSRAGVLSVGGGTNEEDDLYIPFGLYCTPFLFENAHPSGMGVSSAKSNVAMRIFNAQRCKKSQCDISPKQMVSKGFIDNDIFDKLFDAVSYGERDKTQKKTATTTTSKQTRRERS